MMMLMIVMMIIVKAGMVMMMMIHNPKYYFVESFSNSLPNIKLNSTTTQESENLINPLPVQFKSLLHGQEGCVFFSGHLNLRTCQYV
jgi:hypothetical protein